MKEVRIRAEGGPDGDLIITVQGGALSEKDEKKLKEAAEEIMEKGLGEKICMLDPKDVVDK